jgi:hypothetical protein
MMKEWELKEMSSSEPEIETEDLWPPCIMTVEEFIEDCDQGALIDYDGHAEMLTKEGDVFVPHGRTWPSERHKIPKLITHIEWFNR